MSRVPRATREAKVGFVTMLVVDVAEAVWSDVALGTRGRGVGGKGLLGGTEVVPVASKLVVTSKATERDRVDIALLFMIGEWRREGSRRVGEMQLQWFVDGVDRGRG